MPLEGTEIEAAEAMEILRSDSPFSPIYSPPAESQLIVKETVIQEIPSTSSTPSPLSPGSSSNGEPVIRGSEPVIRRADPADKVPELSDPDLLPRHDQETLPLPENTPAFETGNGEKAASKITLNPEELTAKNVLIDELQRKIISLEGELIGRDAVIRKLESTQNPTQPTGTEPPMIAPRINIPGVEVRQDVGEVRVAVPDSLLFQRNAPFKLQQSGEETLRRVVSEIRVNYPQKPLLIEGHTDNITLNPQNPTYLIEVSTFKATVVAQHLATNLDIDTDFLEAAGIGARDPLESNDTEEGRARNRRIEFVLRAER